MNRNIDIKGINSKDSHYVLLAVVTALRIGATGGERSIFRELGLIPVKDAVNDKIGSHFTSDVWNVDCTIIKFHTGGSLSYIYVSFGDQVTILEGYQDGASKDTFDEYLVRLRNELKPLLEI